MARQYSGPKKGKSAAGRFKDKVFNRLFCKRSIIIISEHKTRHLPIAGSTQMVAVVASLFMVGWASYSSGSYMAAQKILVEKEQKLASTTVENQRVEAEFGMLKRDLAKLATDDKSGGQLADYAKQMSQQLAQEDAQPANPNDKYNVMFQRIDMLENKVKDLQSTHDEMLADIRTTTGGKIKEFNSILAETGVNAPPLLEQAQAKQNQAEQAKEKYGRAIDPNAKGGPLEPVPGSVLKEKETELYFNIKQMMTLRDIVAALPLANPDAADAHETSGFGVRIDPFTGALGFHSGVDLAGPAGGPIKAANEGTVSFAGWKNAYGNAVDIDHQYGFSTRYGHLSKILVKEGQHVSKGEVIALQGSTGRSTGNHLHYEVRYNDEPINPKKFLKAGEDHVQALN